MKERERERESEEKYNLLALIFRSKRRKNKVRGYYCQCCFYRLDQRNETIIYLKVDKGYQIFFHLNVLLTYLFT